MTVRGPGHKITPEAPCRLCGGTIGAGWDGAHALCNALAERGMPTPSLGKRCPCCLGAGVHPRSACGPINPNQDAIERWAPSCVTCQGSGAVEVADARLAREHARDAQRRLHWYERCRPVPDVDDDGETYHWTGKTGTHVATGAASAEYDNGRGRRLWARWSGEILDRNT